VGNVASNESNVEMNVLSLAKRARRESSEEDDKLADTGDAALSAPDCL